MYIVYIAKLWYYKIEYYDNFFLFFVIYSVFQIELGRYTERNKIRRVVCLVRLKTV